MVNEAARCLDEEVVAAAEDIDTGMVFGTGFPPFRGGLCRWADAEGISALVDTMADLARREGQRFEPSRYFTKKSGFYQ